MLNQIHMDDIRRKVRGLNAILFLFALGLALNIITFLTLYYKIRPERGILALRYNILTGVDLYGKGSNLYFIPAVGLAVLIVNFFLFRALKDPKLFLSFLTVFVSIGVQLVLLLAVIFLMKVN